MDPPASLHQGGVYRLPPDLIRAYREELLQRNLLERARQGTSESEVHGGESVEESIDHFTYRFQTSASRPQFVLLTSEVDFAAIQTDLLSTFSSHRVALLDLACGTGAGALALLCVVAELRRDNKLPSLPLDVTILGADFSPSARSIFESMCLRLAPELAKSAMTIQCSTAHWDGRHSDTTSSLCDELLKVDANEYLLIINNFSGQGRAILEPLKFSWKHVGDRMLSATPTRMATWTWLEHHGNSGQEFLNKIKSFFSTQMTRVFTHQRSAPATKYQWFDTVTGKEVLSGVTVQQYRRK